MDVLMIVCASYWVDLGCVDVRAVAMTTKAQCAAAHRNVFTTHDPGKEFFKTVLCIAPDGSMPVAHDAPTYRRGAKSK